jgi:hypothetical protein
MDRVYTFFCCERYDILYVQISLNGTLTVAYLISFIRFKPMQAEPIFLRINGYRAKAEFGCGAKDTDRDFTAIQGQQFFHGDYPQGNIGNSFEPSFVLHSKGGRAGNEN